MKTSTTFKGAAKPFGKSGHFDEPRRHSLQAKGIKTGHYALEVGGAYVMSGLTKKEFDFTKQRLKREGRSFVALKDSDHDGVPDKYDCAPHDPTRQDFQAGEVLRQLGGNKFIAMTGAKDFVRDDAQQKISFKIGRNAKSINYVTITLNSMDTYDIVFLRARAGKITVVSKVDGIYNDQLQDVFTEHTGLYTHL